MVIFNSYVKLPEGNWSDNKVGLKTQHTNKYESGCHLGSDFPDVNHIFAKPQKRLQRRNPQR